MSTHDRAAEHYRERANTLQDLQAAPLESGSKAAVDEPDEAEFECAGFEPAARQTLAACGGPACCEDMLEREACAALAGSMVELFPAGAFRRCASRLGAFRRGESSTMRERNALRAAVACQLQNELSLLLSGERWEPDTCRAQLPAAPSKKSSDQAAAWRVERARTAAKRAAQSGRHAKSRPPRHAHSASAHQALPRACVSVQDSEGHILSAVCALAAVLAALAEEFVSAQ